MFFAAPKVLNSAWWCSVVVAQQYRQWNDIHGITAVNRVRGHWYRTRTSIIVLVVLRRLLLLYGIAMNQVKVKRQEKNYTDTCLQILWVSRSTALVTVFSGLCIGQNAA